MKALVEMFWNTKFRWGILLGIGGILGGIFLGVLLKERHIMVVPQENATDIREMEKLSKDEREDLARTLESDVIVPGEEESSEEEDSIADERERLSKDLSISDAFEPGEDKQHTQSSAISIEDRIVSFGSEKASKRMIDTIILHSSYNSLEGDPYSVDRIIDIYRSYSVAAHYLIARDGTVYRLVREADIAYHAGVSEVPDGRKGVNAFSIGIEIIGKDDEHPTDAEYETLKKLISDIRNRYAVKYVLGHEDIAPGRKTDPWGLDWNRIGGKKK